MVPAGMKKILAPKPRRAIEVVRTTYPKGPISARWFCPDRGDNSAMARHRSPDRVQMGALAIVAIILIALAAKYLW